MQARFLAIEGLDGSGGTTQTAALAACLRDLGARVLTTREPSDLPAGRLIRAALRGEAQVSDRVLPYLFAADRRDHLDREILPGLAGGTWVLSDRYLASSLAYQSLEIPFSRVVELNADFPLPDVTIQLDLPPEACMARILARGAARERFEGLELLRSIDAGYTRALAWCEARGGRVVRVDASAPAADVTRAILQSLRDLGMLSAP